MRSRLVVAAGASGAESTADVPSNSPDDTGAGTEQPISRYERIIARIVS